MHSSQMRSGMTVNVSPELPIRVHHAGENGGIFLHAAIHLSVEFTILHVPRVVSGEAGDGTTSALIVVMGTKAAKAFDAKGIAGSRLHSQKKRGGIRQGSSERIRFARRGGNRGAGREDGKDGICRRKTICLVCRDVC